MHEVDDYSDERLKAWCIHCGGAIANIAANRDHVPSKSLLSEDLRERGRAYDLGEGKLHDYLPQVFVCKDCNSGFAADETYFLCVLHAVMAGTLYPDPSTHPVAAKVLRSNRHIVRTLKDCADGQMFLFGQLPPFTVYPEADRIRRVVIKNARGHAYHELGEPMLEGPTSVSFQPLMTMSSEDQAAFEDIGGGMDIWPEVGSRMTVHLIGETGMAGGWMEVEKDRYRYAIDWSEDIVVRTVIWNYLATETRWTR